MAYSDYMAGREAVVSVVPTAPARIDEDAALPVTPSEIATQVDECATMGAAIASLYGWTDRGEPAAAALPDVAAAVREQAGDVLIEYAVGPECPLGDYLDVLDERPRPELALVRLTPAQYGRRGAGRRSRTEVDRFIAALHDRAITPNLLVESGRDLQELYRLLADDKVSRPVVTVRLGARNGGVATPLALLSLLDSMPDAASVIVAATGPNQYPLTTLALILGAHARVGMGDNRYLGFEEPVDRNIQLLQRVAEVIYHSERTFAELAWIRERFELSGPRMEPS